VRVEVDPSRCIGSGQCVVAASAVFDQSPDDGVVVLLRENPPAELDQAVIEAVSLCPTQAIWVNEKLVS
jgi:ferredoxin